MCRVSRLLALLSLMAAATLQAATLQAQQPPNDRERVLTRSPLFEDNLSLYDGALEVPVVFEKLTIDVSSERLEVDYPFRGVLLVHVRAGEVTIFAGDQGAEYRTGDFVVVPPGSDFGVQTEDDQVILAAYLIGESFIDAFPDKPVVSRYTRPDGFYTDATENLRYREAYRVGDPENPLATIRDYNVGPGLQTGSYRSEGAAVFQVSSGSALTVVGDGDEARRQLGDSFALSEGEALSIDNSQSERPFRLRALVFQK